MANTYPCDGPEGFCPFDAVGGYDCRNYCGLGVDESEEDNYEEEDYCPDKDMEIKNVIKKENDNMANINNIKNPIEIYNELKAKGATFEPVIIDGKYLGIMGSFSKYDREMGLKTANDMYIASGGDVFEMKNNMEIIATLAEKGINPDEVVNVCGEDIILSYEQAKAYTMYGEEIVSCDDLPAMPIEAVKAVLIARAEAALK